MSDPGQYVIITTLEDMTRRARRAMELIAAANGGEDPPHLGDGEQINREAWCELIWCLETLAENGLCPHPDADLLTRAGVRPIAEVLGDD